MICRISDWSRGIKGTEEAWGKLPFLIFLGDCLCSEAKFPCLFLCFSSLSLLSFFFFLGEGETKGIVESKAWMAIAPKVFSFIICGTEMFIRVRANFKRAACN